jgi:hypothetical protein
MARGQRQSSITCTNDPHAYHSQNKHIREIDMQNHPIQGLLTALAIACGLCSAGAACAADVATTTEASTPAKKAKKPKAPKPPTDKGYGENRAERDKRLLRECRGKPNTGACEGYAN